MSVAKRSGHELYRTLCSWNTEAIVETDESITFSYTVTVDASAYYSAYPGASSFSVNPRTYAYCSNYWGDGDSDRLLESLQATLSPTNRTWTHTGTFQYSKGSSKKGVWIGIAVYQGSGENPISESERLIYNTATGSTTEWTPEYMAGVKNAGAFSITFVTQDNIPDGYSAAEGTSLPIVGSGTMYTPVSATDLEVFKTGYPKRHTGKYSVYGVHKALKSSNEPSPVYVCDVAPGESVEYSDLECLYSSDKRAYRTYWDILSCVPIWQFVGLRAKFFDSDGEEIATLPDISFNIGDSVTIPQNYAHEETATIFVGWSVPAPVSRTILPGESFMTNVNTQASLMMDDEGLPYLPITAHVVADDNKARAYVYDGEMWRFGDLYVRSGGSWQ